MSPACACRAACAGTATDCVLNRETLVAHKHLAALQEYMDLGIMQRKHFALDQINHAVDLMQSLSYAGKPRYKGSLYSRAW